MSKLPFFSLYLDILELIIQLYRLEQLERIKPLDRESIDVSFSFQMHSELKASLNLPVMIPKVLRFLEQLMAMKPGMQVKYNQSELHFQKPLTRDQSVKQAIAWHSPTFFSLLQNSSDLLIIIAAILLDKSIIVVGTSNSVLSSIVNTLKLIVEPLQYLQTSITILPYELIDILDAPMPFMVGILEETWSEYTQGIEHELGQIDKNSYFYDKCVIQTFGGKIKVVCASVR